MRAVVFLLLVVLVFLIVRFTLNRIIAIREQQNRENQAGNENQNNSSQSSANGEMVRCAQCGVHLPQSEAYYDGKDTFCSEGHMKAYHHEHQS
ncbi:PP0621 family protein [Thiomicrorhabdus sediminis]|uniref:Preprotein translocase subunit YajC n=1 Tax=Thiomicrorhabdus sediminis TaxID=2580412 RepID=A0A4P9K583_9GAMM|nr:PP0621 family protein [Thiomicrorhabdus sediminis]QCU90018.1 hypothetical protein FE785_04915 [Thiomicrorhabdus sediminis]